MKRMTNLEYIIGVLTNDPRFADDPFDDAVNNFIQCPYRGKDPRAHCNDIPRREWRMCAECKVDWLDREIDL